MVSRKISGDNRPCFKTGKKAMALCKGKFSEKIKQVLSTDETGTAFLHQPCETCGGYVVAQNKAGEWVPQTHNRPTARRRYKGWRQQALLIVVLEKQVNVRLIDLLMTARNEYDYPCVFIERAAERAADTIELPGGLLGKYRTDKAQAPTSIELDKYHQGLLLLPRM